MLSAQEFENIFDWKPYRTDWPVDINLTDQSILAHFGHLIKDMVNNPAFECTQTQAGDITNYLEFLCYPSNVKDNNLDQPGILVCISLCAPLAAYGETLFKKDKKSFVYAFPAPAQVCVVEDEKLQPIESEIKAILSRHGLELVTTDYASQPLTAEMAANLDSLNFGNKVLHGLFQWRDQ